MIFLSATQVSQYRDECARKWAWRYRDGIKVPQKPGAALGTEVDDEQIQPYLRGERDGFDYTRDSGYIAASMLAYLPKPKTVEIQRRIEIQSTAPGGEVFAFQGYVDMWAPDSIVFPETPGGVPGVGDTKTTKNFRYAKTEKELRTNVQAQLYAAAALLTYPEAPAVDLVWIYGRTQGARASRRAYLRVVKSDVIEQYEGIHATAVEMLDVHKRGARALDLIPNTKMCDEFGGCPYRDRCNLSPSAFASRPNEERPMANAAEKLAELRAKKAAQQAGSVGGQGAPEAPTTPAPAAADAAPVAPPSSPPVSEPPAPAGLPAWATAPVDPLKAAHAAGKAYTAPTAPAAPTPAAAAPLGINPPESALPPAPPVGTSDGAEPAKKRGRPAKAATSAPAEAAPVVNEAPPTPYVVPTFRVVWGVERVQPVQYNHFDVGPFEAAGQVLPGETFAQATARVYAELEAFAERVRVKKAQSFAAAIGGGK